MEILTEDQITDFINRGYTFEPSNNKINGLVMFQVVKGCISTRALCNVLKVNKVLHKFNNIPYLPTSFNSEADLKEALFSRADCYKVMGSIIYDLENKKLSEDALSKIIGIIGCQYSESLITYRIADFLLSYIINNINFCEKHLDLLDSWGLLNSEGIKKEIQNWRESLESEEDWNSNEEITKDWKIDTA